MAKKPAPIYRTLLRDAWRVTWHRKSLWVFGLFAALLSSGGIFELAWRSLRRVEQGTDVMENVLRGSVMGYETLQTYVQLTQVMTPTRVTLTVTALVVLGIFVIVTAVVSQGALISGVQASKEHTLSENIRRSKPHFWQVLLLNLLSKILLVVLMAVTTLPLTLVALGDFSSETILAFVVLALFLPAVVAIYTIFMFSLIAIVREEEHVLHAIHRSFNLFCEHWATTIEFGMLQFFLVFGAWLAGIAGFLLLLIPFTLLLMLSLLSGAPMLFILAHIIGGVVACALFFFLVGGTTVFQYASWSLFYERALHRKPGLPKLKTKLQRLWAKR